MEYDSSAWTGRKKVMCPVYFNVMNKLFYLYFGFGAVTCHKYELAWGFWLRNNSPQGEYKYHYNFSKRWHSLRKQYDQ